MCEDSAVPRARMISKVSDGVETICWTSHIVLAVTVALIQIPTWNPHDPRFNSDSFSKTTNLVSRKLFYVTCLGMKPEIKRFTQPWLICASKRLYIQVSLSQWPWRKIELKRTSAMSCFSSGISVSLVYKFFKNIGGWQQWLDFIHHHLKIKDQDANPGPASIFWWLIHLQMAGLVRARLMEASIKCGFREVSFTALRPKFDRLMPGLFTLIPAAMPPPASKSLLYVMGTASVEGKMYKTFNGDLPSTVSYSFSEYYPAARLQQYILLKDSVTINKDVPEASGTVPRQDVSTGVPAPLGDASQGREDRPSDFPGTSEEDADCESPVRKNLHRLFVPMHRWLDI